MLSLFGWSALAVPAPHLALFFWGGVLAAGAAKRPEWLFRRPDATGWALRDSASPLPSRCSEL